MVIEIESEEDYQRVTMALAKQLLSEYTPDQIAVIAAQHVIYRQEIEESNSSLRETVQSFKATLDAVSETSSIKDQLIECEKMKNKILVRETAKIASLVLTSYKSTRARKSAGEAHKENRQMADEIKSWYQENKDKYLVLEAAVDACVEAKIVPLTRRTIYKHISSVFKKETSSASKG